MLDSLRLSGFLAIGTLAPRAHRRSSGALGSEEDRSLVTMRRIVRAPPEGRQRLGREQARAPRDLRAAPASGRAPGDRPRSRGGPRAPRSPRAGSRASRARSGWSAAGARDAGAAAPPRDRRERRERNQRDRDAPQREPPERARPRARGGAGAPPAPPTARIAPASRSSESMRMPSNVPSRARSITRRAESRPSISASTRSASRARRRAIGCA